MSKYGAWKYDRAKYSTADVYPSVFALSSVAAVSGSAERVYEVVTYSGSSSDISLSYVRIKDSDTSLAGLSTLEAGTTAVRGVSSSIDGICETDLSAGYTLLSDAAVNGGSETSFSLRIKWEDEADVIEDWSEIDDQADIWTLVSDNTEVWS